jgi:PhnB protein
VLTVGAPVPNQRHGPGGTFSRDGVTVASTLNPYLQFLDTCRDAMEFYKSVFGGELSVSTFGEFAGVDGADAADANKVMHAMLKTPSGYTLMASDTATGMNPPSGHSCSMSLSGDDVDELRGYWAALAADGQVHMPLEKQMWGDEFGMCVDKFGVPWMVNIASGEGEQA